LAIANAPGGGTHVFAYLQRIGRALMLPIAVLPAAAILLRFGQPDLLNIPWMADAGDAIFSNLPLLFAVGVAAGFTADVGTAAVAGAVGYWVFSKVLVDIGVLVYGKDEALNTAVLGGIMMGLVAAALYERYHSIRLPEWLAFFGGRRFVPIMMFGLPAAALAMYTTARSENKKIIGGILLSAALTSIITGVTEPIEFAFMFVAPVLYLLHAVLTGLSAFITISLGIRDGFGFSAGLTDYLLNFGIAKNPVLLLVVGAVFAVIYYVS